jgi:DNA-binding transcriptional ArsR family regulator
VEARKQRPAELSPPRGWTFITHHAQVLLAVARDPSVRVREIAEAADITERYVYRLLSDLQKAGYVRRSRRGRRNQYRVNPALALGDPVAEEHSLRELMQLIGRSDGGDQVTAFGLTLFPAERGPPLEGALNA